MTTIARDTTARRIAVAALCAAFGGYFFGAAHADPTTEPDAAALAQRVDALEQQVAQLSSRTDTLENTTSTLVDSANDQAASIDELGSFNPSCLAYSDFHAYRETLGPNGRKYWSMPIMMWNMASPDCRPNPQRTWKPKKHHAAIRIIR